jgi:hypothetical protein
MLGTTSERNTRRIAASGETGSGCRFARGRTGIFGTARHRGDIGDPVASNRGNLRCVVLGAVSELARDVLGVEDAPTLASVGVQDRRSRSSDSSRKDHAGSRGRGGRASCLEPAREPLEQRGRHDRELRGRWCRDIRFEDYRANNHVLFSLVTLLTTEIVGQFEAAYRLGGAIPALSAVALVAWWAWWRLSRWRQSRSWSSRLSRPCTARSLRKRGATA